MTTHPLYLLQESSAKDMIKSLEDKHSQLESRLPEHNEDLEKLLCEWGLSEDVVKRNGIVLTDYHAVEKLTNGLAIKW